MSGIITTGKVLTHAVKNLIQCAEENMNLQFRDHTEAEQEAYDRKCRDAGANAGIEATEGAESTIREKLTGNLLERGFGKHDAERMVEQ